MFDEPCSCRLERFFLAYFRKPRLIKSLAVFKILGFVKTMLVLAIQEGRLAFRELCRRKHSLHRIVVACWHWIELVIMTACTLQHVPEKNLPDRVCDVI